MFEAERYKYSLDYLSASVISLTWFTGKRQNILCKRNNEGQRIVLLDKMIKGAKDFEHHIRLMLEDRKGEAICSVVM